MHFQSEAMALRGLGLQFFSDCTYVRGTVLHFDWNVYVGKYSSMPRASLYAFQNPYLLVVVGWTVGVVVKFFYVWVLFARVQLYCNSEKASC